MANTGNRNRWNRSKGKDNDLNIWDGIRKVGGGAVFNKSTTFVFSYLRGRY